MAPPRIQKEQVVKLLVTDLDNTLYDWVSFFVEAFYAMVDKAVSILEVSKEDLLDQLRAVHRRHHNSEQPFALLETEVVHLQMPELSRADRAARLNDAFHAFNSVRKRTLQVYPGVLETFQTLQRLGVRIVGHTEATVTNVQFRLSKLGLSPYIERLYAVQHSGDGHPNPAREQVLRKVACVRHLRQDERKPDPQVLMDICEDVGVAPSETVYVGDSIARDIGMARAAGVWAAWAQYGTKYNPNAWDALVRVTHWTEDDIQRAKEAKAKFGDAKPHVVLNEFSELLTHFTFTGQRPEKNKI